VQNSGLVIIWALAVNIRVAGFDGGDGRRQAPETACFIFAHDNKIIINQRLE